ncbi:metallophosphoesterase [Streptomyces sp. MST-110588]|uniref:metallophosphoesterase n=1 Tax=Streptomyces sp. MST-110588 TaxID=2833628 RepID=UPI001F5C1B85|nr:metallophosphoesterase [Streptomyces sp. MST-110588]UNO38809.1 metallophosphoesterase [Streptomyces sp. MST-110588]
MIVIAHLSDTHLDNTPRSTERARAVMAYLEALPYDLDAVLVTGDIADHGRPAEYELSRRVLASRHPVFLCPGNHDVRTAFRKVLLDGGSTEAEGREGEPVNRIHRTRKAVFLLCDSTIPGQDDGRLDDGTLGWLASALRETRDEGLPVFVAFHHPPVDLHTPPIDAIRQSGEHRLAGLVADAPHVVAFLCGHAHTAAATTFAGRPLLVAPGVVSTVRLPWEYGAAEEEFVDHRLPPALAFHVLGDDGRLTTHYRTVPTDGHAGASGASGAESGAA